MFYHSISGYNILSLIHTSDLLGGQFLIIHSSLLNLVAWVENIAATCQWKFRQLVHEMPTHKELDDCMGLYTQ